MVVNQDNFWDVLTSFLNDIAQGEYEYIGDNVGEAEETARWLLEQITYVR